MDERGDYRMTPKGLKQENWPFKIVFKDTVSRDFLAKQFLNETII
jgi:hypothetical protein